MALSVRHVLNVFSPYQILNKLVEFHEPSINFKSMERHSAALLFNFIQSTITTPTLQIEMLLQYYSTLLSAPEVMYGLGKVRLSNFKIVIL